MSRKRNRSPVDSSVSDEIRHYDSMNYWDSRYKTILAESNNSIKLNQSKESKTRESLNSLTSSSIDLTREWYFSFSDFQTVLISHHKFSPQQISHRILDIGCGLSNIFNEILQNQWNIELMVGVDYSPSVINYLNSSLNLLSNDSRIVYKLMDFCLPVKNSKNSTNFQMETFDLILDKATSDGLCCTEESAARTPEMYKNVSRLLKPGGFFVIATVSEPESLWFSEYVVDSLIEASSDYRFSVTVHHSDDYYDNEGESPFLYVIQKSIRPIKARNCKETELITIVQKEH